MLELPHIAGSRGGSITLQTRLAFPIPNEQALEPDSQLVRMFQGLLAKHPRWTVRKAPCGVYNCAGHVWASRRTAVYGEEWYKKILQDDGYRLLTDPEASPSHGDLAIYQTADSAGKFLHVGMVTHLEEILVQSGASVSSKWPWVLSKWNSAGEVLHHFADVPFDNGTWEGRFWTDRP